MRKFSNFIKTGDSSKYIKYNAVSGEYKIGNEEITLGYRAKYIPKYGIVNTIERHLAETLAGITCGKPYNFNKNTSECWYCDCKYSSDECILSHVLGRYRPNSPVKYCNKTIFNKCNKKRCV